MRDQRDTDETRPGATAMPGPLDVAAIPPPDPDSVTQLLGEVEKGQPGAWNRIYALLYRDLHQIARSQIRQQRRGHVRSPTSLISETWLKLASADFSVENRAHLVALVARAMRFVLLDEVRRALAEKRGEGMDLLPLDETTEPGQSPRLEQLLILDQALNDLANLDARLAATGARPAHSCSSTSVTASCPTRSEPRQHSGATTRPEMPSGTETS